MPHYSRDSKVSELAVLRQYPPSVPGDRPHSVPSSKRIPRKRHWQPGASGLTGDRPAVTAGSAVRLEFPRRCNMASKPEPGQVDTSSKPSHGKGDLPERRARALTASCRSKLSALVMRKASLRCSACCLRSALARLRSWVLLGTRSTPLMLCFGEDNHAAKGGSSLRGIMAVKILLLLLVFGGSLQNTGQSQLPAVWYALVPPT